MNIDNDAARVSVNDEARVAAANAGTHAAPEKIKKSHLAAVVAAVMLLLGLVFAALSYAQVEDMERGTVEAVAVQQDGYLELVLSQIDLNKDNTDEDIIQNILGTLDGNSGSYWAFSKGQTMLYVKDATETTRYRNLTANSYFSTQSSVDFLAGLSEDGVVHSVIDINGKQYVASGALFTYAGEDYRLCLLTNREILLDSNAMLGARSRLLVLMLFMLAITVCVPIGLAVYAARTRNKLSEARLQLAQGESALQKANRRHSLLDTFQVESEVWRADMLPKFVERAEQRGVPHSHMSVECRDDAARSKLLTSMSMLQDKRVLVFEQDEGNVTLLMLNGTREQLEDALRIALTRGVRA